MPEKQMPYLFFSTYHKIESQQPSQERSSIKARQRGANHSDPILEEVGRRRRLFEAYENEVVHQPSTLDEFYYHFAADPDSIHDRTERNESQVVTKYLWDEGKGTDTWPLLRVSQLWIWVIADSRFPSKLRPSPFGC